MRITCIVLAAAGAAAGLARAESPNPVRTAMKKVFIGWKRERATTPRTGSVSVPSPGGSDGARVRTSARRPALFLDEEVRHQMEFTLTTITAAAREDREGRGSGRHDHVGRLRPVHSGDGRQPAGRGDDGPGGVPAGENSVRTAPGRSVQPAADAGRRFHAHVPRPPRLKAYGHGSNANDADNLACRAEDSYEKGRRWLIAAKPKTTEDESMRLRGLVFVAAGREAIDAAETYC